jgi:secreted trypsin-like serine protease
MTRPAVGERWTLLAEPIDVLRIVGLSLLLLVATEGSAYGITNGDPDGSDSAVVALMQGGDVFCTGVLVDKYVVATAAHCVSGEFKPDQIYFGSNPKGGDGTFVDVADTKAHPQFDAKTLDNDVAVVGLVDAAPVKPVAVLSANSIDDSWLGSTIKIVGFGLTSSDGDAGTKMVGTTTIDGIDDSTFHFSGDPSQTCQGDSGGPAFMKIDGRTTVIGLTSFGDTNCQKYGRDTRVDVQNDFITSYASQYSLGGSSSPAADAGCSLGRNGGARPGGIPAALSVALLFLFTWLRRRRVME